MSDQFSAESVDSSLVSQLARHSNVKYGLEPTPDLETIGESNHETKARSDICSDHCGGADVSHRRIVGQRRWWPGVAMAAVTVAMAAATVVMAAGTLPVTGAVTMRAATTAGIMVITRAATTLVIMATTRRAVT